ncbi:uncharacterized protein LOC119069014 [Bradysia coprophila]|uniref:uncharacterized protein LOC119069014 n=1 Tax=Bradysia coprophila TaxID=38358 RepID=UPI00187D9C13|nr:uncharacterized protein LOC119069014 [Bradysia coprophila]
MEDVKTLFSYINSELHNTFQELKETFVPKKWLKLAEMVMAWIIVFNRRRIGEVQNIRVNEFVGRESVDDDSNKEILAALSTESQGIARKFKRMKIRGKKGRTVPVLMKPFIEKSIEFLIKTRQMAGIPSDRQFLFELPTSSDLQIDACRLLRNLSTSCGANNPSSLRGTTCIALELNEALVGELAKFLGHDEKIHREHYRQNPIDREVVQVAQLLEKASGQRDEFSDDEEDEFGNGGLISGDVDIGEVSEHAETNNGDCGTPDATELISNGTGIRQ